jgi:hypothetical protein
VSPLALLSPCAVGRFMFIFTLTCRRKAHRLGRVDAATYELRGVNGAAQKERVVRGDKVRSGRQQQLKRSAGEGTPSVCTKRTVPCCLPCLSKSHDACRLAAQHGGG